MEKHKILLVEDDELDVISVQRSLKKIDCDCELLTAYNGIEALELLREMMQAPLNKLPDLIILDLNMPRMNGLELLSILKSDQMLKDIEVFIMTTSSDEGERLMAEELGVTGYLIKPLNFYNNNKRTDSLEAFFQFHIGRIFRTKRETR
jgi:CheY-like chemotaxis protein